MARGRKKREDSVIRLLTDRVYIIESDDRNIIVSQNNGTDNPKLNSQNYYSSIGSALSAIHKKLVNKVPVDTADVLKRYNEISERVFSFGESIQKTLDELRGKKIEKYEVSIEDEDEVTV